MDKDVMALGFVALVFLVYGTVAVLIYVGDRRGWWLEP